MIFHAMSRRRGAWVAVLVLSAAVTADAQAPSRRVRAPHTIVELIAEQSPAGSTLDLWLGLRFELEQDWHIYFVNPGDSGSAPSILWTPLPGVTFGTLQWPVPERIQVGPLTDYGYTNEVVLPFRVTGTAPLAGRAPLTAQAQVRWMICKDLCIPGQASLAITLPLPSDDRARLPIWRKQLEQTRARMPKPLPPAWQLRTSARADTVTFTIRMDRDAERVSFIPLHPNQFVEHAPQDSRVEGRSVVLSVKRLPQRTQIPVTVEGILVTASGAGYVIDASAAKPAPARSPK